MKKLYYYVLIALLPLTNNLNAQKRTGGRGKDMPGILSSSRNMNDLHNAPKMMGRPSPKMPQAGPPIMSEDPGRSISEKPILPPSREIEPLRKTGPQEARLSTPEALPMMPEPSSRPSIEKTPPSTLKSGLPRPSVAEEPPILEPEQEMPKRLQDFEEKTPEKQDMPQMREKEELKPIDQEKGPENDRPPEPPIDKERELPEKAERPEKPEQQKSEELEPPKDREIGKEAEKSLKAPRVAEKEKEEQARPEEDKPIEKEKKEREEEAQRERTIKKEKATEEPEPQKTKEEETKQIKSIAQKAMQENPEVKVEIAQTKERWRTDKNTRKTWHNDWKKYRHYHADRRFTFDTFVRHVFFSPWSLFPFTFHPNFYRHYPVHWVDFSWFRYPIYWNYSYAREVNLVDYIDTREFHTAIDLLEQRLDKLENKIISQNRERGDKTRISEIIWLLNDVKTIIMEQANVSRRSKNRLTRRIENIKDKGYRLLEYIED